MKLTPRQNQRTPAELRILEGITKRREAVIAAGIVFECRIIAARAIRNGNTEQLDADLRDWELALDRRTDELEKKRPGAERRKRR